MKAKENFIKWLYKQREKENTITQFLKLIYLIGQKTWIHSMLAFVFGILIPIFYDKGKMCFFVIGILLMCADFIYAYLCNEYQKKMYIKRKFASEILSEQSSLIKSIAIEMENNNSWKNTIFRTVSNLVCEKIYRNFEEIYNCKTRVSIEYIFNKNLRTSAPPVKHVKMSARRSGHRSTVKKSIPLARRNKYYSYKIFANNNNGINVLTEEEINDNDIWYKNPEHSIDIKRYIGIAVSVFDNPEVKFILQIDCLDDIKFGENDSDEDVKEFIENYLMSYINLVSVAYLLNLNNKKEIPEV